VLAEELEVEADDQEALAEFLERKVDEACRRALRGAPPSATPPLPLVRLRVRDSPPFALRRDLWAAWHGGCAVRHSTGRRLWERGHKHEEVLWLVPTSEEFKST